MLVTELTAQQIQHMAYMVAILAFVMGFAGHLLAVALLKAGSAVWKEFEAWQRARRRAEWLAGAGARLEGRRRANGVN